MFSISLEGKNIKFNSFKGMNDQYRTFLNGQVKMIFKWFWKNCTIKMYKLNEFMIGLFILGMRK
jgi:hypothetical protein